MQALVMFAFDAGQPGPGISCKYRCHQLLKPLTATCNHRHTRLGTHILSTPTLRRVGAKLCDNRPHCALRCYATSLRTVSGPPSPESPSLVQHTAVAHSHAATVRDAMRWRLCGWVYAAASTLALALELRNYELSCGLAERRAWLLKCGCRSCTCTCTCTCSCRFSCADTSLHSAAAG